MPSNVTRLTSAKVASKSALASTHTATKTATPPPPIQASQSAMRRWKWRKRRNSDRHRMKKRQKTWAKWAPWRQSCRSSSTTCTTMTRRTVVAMARIRSCRRIRRLHPSLPQLARCSTGTRIPITTCPRRQRPNQSMPRARPCQPTWTRAQLATWLVRPLHPICRMKMVRPRLNRQIQSKLEISLGKISPTFELGLNFSFDCTLNH